MPNKQLEITYYDRTRNVDVSDMSDQSDNEYNSDEEYSSYNSADDIDMSPIDDKEIDATIAERENPPTPKHIIQRSKIPSPLILRDKDVPALFPVVPKISVQKETEQKSTKCWEQIPTAEISSVAQIQKKEEKAKKKLATKPEKIVEEKKPEPVPEEGWEIVKAQTKDKKEKKEKKSVPTSPATSQNENKKYTSFCTSVLTNTPCKYGNRCNYAHRPDQIVPVPCKFGKNCTFVDCKSSEDYNNKGDRICKFWHPQESMLSFATRQGYKTSSKPAIVKKEVQPQPQKLPIAIPKTPAWIKPQETIIQVPAALAERALQQCLEKGMKNFKIITI